MTTSVKIHVNGDYKAKVVQTDARGSSEQEIIGTSEKTFWLYDHATPTTFQVSETPLTDEEKAKRDAPSAAETSGDQFGGH